MFLRDEMEKLRLADRAEAILRTDRHALRLAQQQPAEPPVLLTLVSESGLVVDFMDAYLPEVAEAAGMQYVRFTATGLPEIPRVYLNRTSVVVADLTARDEHVITLVYQAFGSGRRVLLCGNGPSDIPGDLADVPAVFYDLATGEFEDLLKAVENCARPNSRMPVPQQAR